MACLTTTGVSINGIAAAVPRNRVSNLDLPLLTERERQQWVKTVGIESRRVAPAGMTASDLCFAAADALLNDLGWERDAIDVIVLVTQSPDLLLPGAASQLQVRLGLGKHVIAIDLNQGCAGYVYGLSVISAMMAGGFLRRGLLLVGDTITHSLSPEDKSTVPIFSDAGSATALSFDRTASSMHFNLQTDGAGYQAICIPEGGARVPHSQADSSLKSYGEGILRGGLHSGHAGPRRLHRPRRGPPQYPRSLRFCPGGPDSTDRFVFHQANLLLEREHSPETGPAS
ncbi:MAG: ketoacyl-ACP synthase III [Bacteroidia bacterium]